VAADLDIAADIILEADRAALPDIAGSCMQGARYAC
jgi:hypothetical protein